MLNLFNFYGRINRLYATVAEHEGVFGLERPSGSSHSVVQIERIAILVVDHILFAVLYEAAGACDGDSRIGGREGASAILGKCQLEGVVVHVVAVSLGGKRESALLISGSNNANLLILDYIRCLAHYLGAHTVDSKYVLAAAQIDCMPRIHITHKVESVVLGGNSPVG